MTTSVQWKPRWGFLIYNSIYGDFDRINFQKLYFDSIYTDRRNVQKLWVKMVELLLELIAFLFENQHHSGPFSANGEIH